MSDDKDIALLKAKNAELSTQLAQLNASKVKAENDLFITDLLNKGNLLPREKDFAEEILAMASCIDSGNHDGYIALSKGGNLTDKIKDFLRKRMPLDIFKGMQTERMGLFGQPKKRTLWREFGENSPAELDEQIKNYMRNYNVDYKTAFEAVTTIGE